MMDSKGPGQENASSPLAYMKQESLVAKIKKLKSLCWNNQYEV